MAPLNPQNKTQAGQVIELAGEQVALLPERAIYWPAQQALLVADLHWGKDEAFRAEGLALPEGVLAADLERLSSCLQGYAVKTVYVLGDLIHSRAGISEGVSKQLIAWREKHPVSIRLIPGNHDRALAVLPAAWRIETVGTQYDLGPFRLVHDVSAHPGRYTLGGHVHPLVQVGHARERLTLPCFCFGRSSGLLPAFSAFTGGFRIHRRPEDRVYVVTERAVHPL